MEVAIWDWLPADLSFKEKVAYLFVVLEGAPRVDMPVEHTLGNGMYLRKMHIPAATIFLGREHLQGHMVSLLKGSAILITPDGQKFHKEAITSMITPKGYHTVAYTLTDIEVVTYHYNPDGLTDIDALESQIFGPVSEMRDLGMHLHARLAA